MAEFVLIHGGMHGSWCWFRLRPELERRGHLILAPDFPCDDPTAGSADYAQTVASQMDAAGIGDDAIVVAHSLAGLALPLIPALRPVRALVFLCALVPVIGLSYEDQQAPRRHSQEGMLTVDDQGRFVLNVEGARRFFYADADEETADACIARLKPQSKIARTEKTPLTGWPAVPMASIYTTEDAIVTREYSILRATEIGAELVAMKGSHSPFLSEATALADLLDRLAALFSSRSAPSTDRKPARAAP
jgi:pimeloyl-ACP methyl ester carboxylesterase